MRREGSNSTAGKSATVEGGPLDMTVESEGGFPCGEFLWEDLWEDEEDAAAISEETL